MIHEKITLNKSRNVTLETYLIEDNPEAHTGENRPLIIICPGGGYTFLSEREAEPIALHYMNQGFHACVLRYGIGEYAMMPGPIQDAADAIYYIKKHAKEWFVNPDAVFITGFSAGAHVAGSLGVFYNNHDVIKGYEECDDMIRPAGLILCYPVLDLKSSSSHLDFGIKPGQNLSEILWDQKNPDMPEEKLFTWDEKEGRYFVNFETSMNSYILGCDYTDEDEEFYSLQNQVSENTPPTFIWHTAGDGLILPANSLKFANALYANSVNLELHIYNVGNHGMSLADERMCVEPEPALYSWSDLAVAWVKRIVEGHFATAY